MKIFPVVHVRTPEQATEQSALAMEYGADGVYLIHHGDAAPALNRAFNAVAAELGDTAYIGLNYLDLPRPDLAFGALSLAVLEGWLHRYPNALWVDDALMGVENESAYLEEVKRKRTAVPELGTVRFLGGAAFKASSHYTADPELAAKAAVNIAPFVDVVTTSGAGTGYPPTPEKIAAMKAVIGEHPLAVASGVDIENLSSYGTAIDELLVATSIETHRGSGIFATQKLAELIESVHEV